MILAAWFHDLDPIILRISGDFAVRWYGVAYAVGFFLGWLQLNWLGRRGVSLLRPERVPDTMMALIFGVVIGGRLGYVLFYDQQLIAVFTGSFPFWGVLMVNKGGMAFHGALLGLVVAAFMLSRGTRQPDGSRVGRMPMPHLADLIAFAGVAGLMLGRIANFVNGELLGQIVARPGEPGPWWSVQFPQEIGGDHLVPYTTQQLGELNTILDRFGRSTVGIGHARDRLMDAIQTGTGPEHTRLIAELVPLVSSRHPSQIYQAIAEGPILGLVLWLLWMKPKCPGVIVYTFMIVYGVLRVVIEQFFRLPDAQLSVQRILGLSRGQWLSLGMIVAGVVGLAMTRALTRYKDVRLGGWLPERAR